MCSALRTHNHYPTATTTTTTITLPPLVHRSVIDNHRTTHAVALAAVAASAQAFGNKSNSLFSAACFLFAVCVCTAVLYVGLVIDCSLHLSEHSIMCSRRVFTWFLRLLAAAVCVWLRCRLFIGLLNTSRRGFIHSLLVSFCFQHNLTSNVCLSDTFMCCCTLPTVYVVRVQKRKLRFYCIAHAVGAAAAGDFLPRGVSDACILSS